MTVSTITSFVVGLSYIVLIALNLTPQEIVIGAIYIIFAVGMVWYDNFLNGILKSNPDANSQGPEPLPQTIWPYSLVNVCRPNTFYWRVGWLLLLLPIIYALVANYFKIL